MTGVTTYVPELAPKRLEVLRECLPGLRRVAEDAEDVVAQLEGLTERDSVGAVLRQQFWRCPSQGGPEVQWAFDGVLGRLVPRDAKRAFEGMKARGVLVKNVSKLHPLLANCLRLTVGTPDENNSVVQGSIAYYGTYTIDEATREGLSPKDRELTLGIGDLVELDAAFVLSDG